MHSAGAPPPARRRATRGPGAQARHTCRCCPASARRSRACGRRRSSPACASMRPSSATWSPGAACGRCGSAAPRLSQAGRPLPRGARDVVLWAERTPWDRGRHAARRPRSCLRPAGVWDTLGCWCGPKQRAFLRCRLAPALHQAGRIHGRRRARRWRGAPSRARCRSAARSCWCRAGRPSWCTPGGARTTARW